MRRKTGLGVEGLMTGLSRTGHGTGTTLQLGGECRGAKSLILIKSAELMTNMAVGLSKFNSFSKGCLVSGTIRSVKTDNCAASVSIQEMVGKCWL